MAKTKRGSKARERSRVNGDRDLNRTPEQEAVCAEDNVKETNGNGLPGYMSESDR